jgi:hypothetical protein
MAPALMACWIAGGADGFLFSFLLGGDVELPGRSRRAAGVDIRCGGVAEESGAAHFGFGGAPAIKPNRKSQTAIGGGARRRFACAWKTP